MGVSFAFLVAQGGQVRQGDGEDGQAPGRGRQVAVRSWHPVNGKAIVGVLLAVLLVGWTVVAWLNTHEMPEQPCGPAAYSCDWQPDGTFTVWQ